MYGVAFVCSSFTLFVCLLTFSSVQGEGNSIQISSACGDSIEESVDRAKIFFDGGTDQNNLFAVNSQCYRCSKTLVSNGTINNSSTARQVPISGRLSLTTFELDGTAFGLGNYTQRFTDEMVSHSLNSIPQTPPTDSKSYGRSYTSTTDSYVQQTIIFNIKTNSTGTATEIYKNGKKTTLLTLKNILKKIDKLIFA